MSDDDTRMRRRNISLTYSHDKQLERVAEQHYQGNVSQCVRVAVNEHAQILDGGGDAALRRIERDLQKLSEQVTELLTRLTAVEARIETDEGLAQLRTIPGLSYQMARVYQTLLDEVETRRRVSQSSDSGVENSHLYRGVRADDLIERLELNPYDALDALGELVDMGLVRERQNRGFRYVPMTAWTEGDG